MTTALEAFERHKGKLATFRRRFLGNRYRDQPSSSINDEVCEINIGDIHRMQNSWMVNQRFRGWFVYDSDGTVSGQNDEQILIKITSGSGNKFEDTYMIHVD